MKELLHYIKKMQAFSGKALYVNVAAVMIVSFLDGLGILLLVLMLKTNGILPTAVMPVMWQKFSFVSDLFSSASLISILIIFITLTFLQNLLARNVAICDVRIHQKFINHLKEDIYKSLLHVKWEYFLQARKSNLVNSLTKDLSRTSIGLKMFMQLITHLIFTVIQIGMAFYLAPDITLLVLVCGACLALFSWKFVQQAKQLGKETTQLSREYLSGITESFNGMKDIKTNMLEFSRTSWLKSLNVKMLHEQTSYVKLQTSSQIFYKTALACIIASFIFLSVHLLQTAPDTLLFVIIIFTRLWPRFIDIQLNIQMVASSAPACKMLLELQKQAAAYKESDSTDLSVTPLLVHDAIECCNISFRYQKDKARFVLQNIDLHIPANQITAFVGKSGAGKSTLIDILMGLNQPESGSLFLDGVPLTEENLLSFRKTISYVSQDPFLFNTSIRQNLLFMQPHATEKELWDALNFAAADRFVKQLPNGLDTKIGDRGIRLSGGERQRLVLARAILRKPSILVLDEATSSLDTQNEAEIQEALEKIRGKMTIIIIAHRLSTIRHADQIVVLDQGKILQKGEFIELSNDTKNVFSQLLTIQETAIKL